MPSLPRIVCILGLWLGAMGWLTVREILPLFRAGEPPKLYFDVTDEVGTSHVEWSVLYEDRQIATATYQVRRQPDDSYEQTTHYRFQEFPFLPKIKLLEQVELKSLTTRHRVTGSGVLLDMSVTIRASPELRGELKSKVEGGFLTTEVIAYVNSVEWTRLRLPPAELSRMGNVNNPLHMQNRIPGLWHGRTWMVPEVDPFSAISGIVPMAPASIPRMHAEVFTDATEWLGDSVACFRIDHRELGKAVSARVWVRRRDGLVIRHEAESFGRALIMIREPAK